MANLTVGTMPVATTGTNCQDGPLSTDGTTTTSTQPLSMLANPVQFVGGGTATIASDGDGGLNFTDQGGNVINFNQWDESGLKLPDNCNLLMGSATSGTFRFATGGVISDDGQGGVNIKDDLGNTLNWNNDNSNGLSFSGVLSIVSGAIALGTGNLTLNTGNMDFNTAGTGISGSVSAAFLVNERQLLQSDGTTVAVDFSGTPNAAAAISINGSASTIEATQRVNVSADGNTAQLCSPSHALTTIGTLFLDFGAFTTDGAGNVTAVSFTGSGAGLTGTIFPDTGWTANADGGNKASSIPSSATLATIATALNIISSGAGTALQAAAEKCKALETALSTNLLPNA
jgi:hypothetical protein